MKKLCFSTLGCVDYSLEQIVSLAKKCSFDALEVRGIGGELNNTEIECFKPEKAAETRKYLENENIKLLSLGTSACCDKIGNDELQIAKVFEEIDVASAMGFENIRVFGNNIPEDYEIVRKRVCHALSELCDYAKGKDVRVLLETHGDFSDEETLLPIIDEMGKYSNFAVIWDIAHSDLKYKSDWKSFYNAIKEKVVHIHVKDHTREPFALTTMGEGDIPIREICDYLESDGYNGYFSLEWEKKWHPELENIEDALEKFLHIMND